MRDVLDGTRLTMWTAIALAFALAGCAGGGGGDDDDDGDGKGDCVEGDTACGTIEFANDVQPIITVSCTGCHGSTNAAAGLNLATLAGIQSVVTACDCAGSLLYQKTGTTPPFGQRMPLGGPFLSDAQRETICSWIDEGAEATFDAATCDTDGGTPDGGPVDACGDGTCAADETCSDCEADCGECPTSGCVDPAPGDEVDYPSVKNILAANCTGCHGAPSSNPAAGLSLTNIPGVQSVVTACDRAGSLLFQKIGPTPPFGDRMPKFAAPLTDSEIDRIGRWIDQGAETSSN